MLYILFLLLVSGFILLIISAAKKPSWPKIATIAIIIGLIIYAFRPVCVPLTDEDLKSFNVPIEQQTSSRDFYLKIWQFKNGKWHQCKTAISRFFFA